MASLWQAILDFGIFNTLASVGVVALFIWCFTRAGKGKGAGGSGSSSSSSSSTPPTPPTAS